MLPSRLLSCQNLSANRNGLKVGSHWKQRFGLAHIHSLQTLHPSPPQAQLSGKKWVNLSNADFPLWMECVFRIMAFKGGCLRNGFSVSFVLSHWRYSQPSSALCVLGLWICRFNQIHFKNIQKKIPESWKQNKTKLEFAACQTGQSDFTFTFHFHALQK